MNEFMKTLLSLSVSGTLLLLLILGLKRLYKNKFSRCWQYYIWIIVALRFLLPFTPDTTIVGSLFEKFDRSVIKNEISISPSAPAFINVDNSENEPIQTDQNIAAIVMREPLNIYVCLFFIWSAVALALFVRKITVYQGFIQYIKAGNTEVSDIKILNLLSDCEEKLNIKTRVELSCNPLIVSPMLIGFFRPRIILPVGELEDKKLSYIFVHELIHYKQRDLFYKWLMQIVVCLHWFNPFAYLLEKEVNQSCELSCDEKVISILGDKARREYGDTLISFLKPNHFYKSSLASVTLTEKAEQLKERLGAIMDYNKKNNVIRILTGGLTLCIIFAAAFVGSYHGVSASMSTNQEEQNHYENQSKSNNNVDNGLPGLEELEPIVDDNWPISISRTTENTTAKSLSFDIQIDEPMVIEVSCVTESGKMNMEIKDTNGNKLFDEKNMKTETFEVNISKAGTYTVIMQTKNHTGSFRIAPKK